eukprot:CAMPEP_0175843114 /NCGR_PEP_ID=MMETSP0107_2-20121207/20908_1 /TAXON_ID=195067 ORGANISM="Goniomonas pacifica, Strain CCMP1869" /NCGR_SAMPLE_ID=MMETSP0107_2 /ASSEMBLY_ACC=CAM_ASM_000203 /LENGTH=85 /DNA_ID=CAMNT_0017157363 /DNA_START=322 /DNA_END=580 /DNA_ORIENTATION=-
MDVALDYLQGTEVNAPVVATGVASVEACNTGRLCHRVEAEEAGGWIQGSYVLDRAQSCRQLLHVVESRKGSIERRHLQCLQATPP